MTTPDRIALRWEVGKAVTSGPLMDHPDYTQYIRADLARAPALEHVNETAKIEHDAGNVLTDAALIARLREIQGQAGLFASAAANRIEALEAALLDISDPLRLTSHGDPTVLRDRARAALLTEKPHDR